MEKLRKFFEGKKKERLNLLMLVFISGIFILISTKNILPQKEEKENTGEELAEIEEVSYEENLEKRLENILSQVNGAGTVNVMITFSQKESIIVEKNINSVTDSTEETDKTGGIRNISKTQVEETVVFVTDSDGNTKPLVLYETIPKVEGVIIVATGGGDVFVKESLIRSTMAALNIPINKVEVLKRK